MWVLCCTRGARSLLSGTWIRISVQLGIHTLSQGFTCTCWCIGNVLLCSSHLVLLLRAQQPAQEIDHTTYSESLYLENCGPQNLCKHACAKHCPAFAVVGSEQWSGLCWFFRAPSPAPCLTRSAEGKRIPSSCKYGGSVSCSARIVFQDRLWPTVLLTTKLW